MVVYAVWIYTITCSVVEVHDIMVILHYRPPNKKFEDKVFIPQDNHPETNFVGLLIGPRYIKFGSVHSVM